MRLGTFLGKLAARWSVGAQEAVRITPTVGEPAIPKEIPAAKLDGGKAPPSSAVQFAPFDLPQASESFGEQVQAPPALEGEGWQELSRRMEEQSRRFCPSLYDEEGNRMG